MKAMPNSLAPRTDTLLYTGKLGIWLFLAAEFMFFGALYSSYAFLRTAAEFWPSGSMPGGLAAFATVAITIACIAAARAWIAALADPLGTPVPWALGAAAAALAFTVLLALQLKFVSDTRPAATGNYYGLYYLLLMLHIASGAGAFGAMAWQGIAGKVREELAIRRGNQLECCGLYLQAQGILWLITYLLFHVV